MNLKNFGLVLTFTMAVFRWFDTFIGPENQIETAMIMLGGIIIYELAKIIEILEKQK